MNILQLILPILFIGVSVLGGIFFVFPKYQVFTEVQAAIEERQARVEKGEEVLVRLRDLKREVETRQQDFAKLQSAIPTEAAVPRTYHELQRIGVESGLVLSDISSEEERIEQKNVSLTKTTVTLEFQGSYQSVKSFLSLVQSFGRMLNTQSVLLEAQDNDDGILRLQVDINTYAS